jgi:transposase
VPIEGVDLEQLQKLADAGASVTISAADLRQILVKVRDIEIELERTKAKLASYESNSRNSSKPPSSDRHNPNKPDQKPKGKRGKKDGKGDRKRKPGGQKGHKGKTLEQVAAPDHVQEHKLDRINGSCEHCQGSLRGTQSTDVESRQVFNLPEKITFEVTEHRAETGTCPCCSKKVKAAFPEDVTAHVQYGDRVQALVLYLHTYQLLPCERLAEFFDDIFNCPLSTGVICSMLKKAGTRAGPIYESIKGAILQAVFVHCDETGLSVSGKLHWLHTASTPELTFLHVDKHRGQVALRAIGILENYDGWVVHDYLSAYYTIYGLKHVLCNAHMLRDLICIHEDHEQSWAKEMMDLLLEAKKLKERELAGGRTIGQGTLDRLRARYEEIINDGYALNPEPERRPGQRGRLKRGKPLNILIRLDERHQEVMAFLLYDVPFDNNLAERDLRMMKVKQKISGCFRSFDHATAFAKLRSIISTAKKQSINVLDILSKVVTNPAQAQQILIPS